MDVDRQIVKEHIAQAAAQNDAQHDAGQQVVHIGGTPARTGARRPPAAQAPAHGKTDEVHEAVPAQLEAADGNGYGINMRHGHAGNSGALNSPLLPPLLCSRRTRLMTMSRCTALHMS